MNGLKTAVLVIIVVGYFGIEVYQFHRMGYRMEPLFIFEKFAAANVAAELCGPVDEDERQRFLRNFRHVTRRAVEELDAQASDVATTSPKQGIAELEAAQRSEVEALIAEQSCAGPEVKRLVKFHEIRARLKLRG